ncbi:MAG: hypothetical protein A4E53_00347 [Pelotomaculum sp. PtaB.Bin104]|nr:MAG: hypothetical protein A4E53_00347 [Pelotomaculum sp. PtaB.Bin104]
MKHNQVQDIKELSAEIFESALDYLPRLVNGLLQASNHFKGNEYTEGYQILQEASEGLMWFSEVVHGLPLLLPQGESMIDITENWQSYLNALNNILPSIEKGDGIALSRLLDNEVVPFIVLVYEIINNLKPGSEYSQ